MVDETLNDLLLLTGLRADPETYRDQGTLDVDGRRLDLLYRRIKTHFGPEAAHNYARMVADVPFFNTRDFLASLYSLQENGWLWRRDLLPVDRKRVDVRSKDSLDEFFMAHSARATFITKYQLPTELPEEFRAPQDEKEEE